MEQTNTIETENFNHQNPPRYKNYGIIEKNLAMAGITPNLADQSYPFTWTILFGFLLLGNAIYCISVFIVRDAKTLSECTQSIFMVSLATLNLFALIILVFKAKKLFQFIDDNDVFINTSKCGTTKLWTTMIICRINLFLKCFFSTAILSIDEVLQRERKLSEAIFFVTMKMTPVCALLPFVIYTNFIYFTTDLGRAAFELPAPMW